MWLFLSNYRPCNILGVPYTIHANIMQEEQDDKKLCQVCNTWGIVSRPEIKLSQVSWDTSLFRQHVIICWADEWKVLPSQHRPIIAVTGLMLAFCEDQKEKLETHPSETKHKVWSLSNALCYRVDGNLQRDKAHLLKRNSLTISCCFFLIICILPNKLKFLLQNQAPLMFSFNWHHLCLKLQLCLQLKRLIKKYKTSKSRLICRLNAK